MLPELYRLALNDRPESETVIPASCGRSLALYVMYLTSADIAVSLWHISAISIASPSLIATPHTHDAAGKLVQSQCLTCTCNVIHRFRSPNFGLIHIYESGENDLWIPLQNWGCSLGITPENNRKSLHLLFWKITQKFCRNFTVSQSDITSNNALIPDLPSL